MGYSFFSFWPYFLFSFAVGVGLFFYYFLLEDMGMDGRIGGRG